MTELVNEYGEPIAIKRRGKQVRQDDVMEALLRTQTVSDAADVAGVSRRTIYAWLDADPAFRQRWEQGRKKQKIRRTPDEDREVPVDLFRERPQPSGLEEFRMEAFGFPSNDTQAAFCRAYDDEQNLVIFWVAPAGAGKDVTAMQSVAHSAAKGIARMGCLMENERQAKKRIDSYLDPYFTDHTLYTRAPDIPGGQTPTLDFIAGWGPFKWDPKLRLPDGTRPPQVKWEAHNKWFVGRSTPMADPNLWAVGVGSAIAGSRVQYLICSDLFTVENQKSPKTREDQLDLINGTVASRLDEAGRLVFLNHHVGPDNESNLVTLIDSYVGDARIIEADGDYTKYSNGVATVITPALTINEDGEDESYWPERFPVRDTIILPDGTRHVAAELSDEQLKTMRGRRVRGLVETRQRIGDDLFNLIYQQQPGTVTYGDFTWEILDGCDDPNRSLGVSRPGEILICGVDPARSGGAGWVLWALEEKTGTFTLVDYFFGTGLGFTGMRDQLLRQPIERWRPRYYVWEENYEDDPRQHPEAKEIIHQYHVNYVPHRTHHNRTTGDHNVISMLDDMRSGQILFPAQTEEDRLKSRRVKEHFVNFESAGYQERRSGKARSRLDDDLAMAAWFGWRHGHTLLKSRRRKGRRSTVQSSQTVQDAFGGYRL